MFDGADANLLREMTPADVPEVLAGQEEAAVVGLTEVFAQDAYPFPREALEQRWQVEREGSTLLREAGLAFDRRRHPQLLRALRRATAVRSHT